MDFEFETCRRIIENLSEVIIGKRKSMELVLAGLLGEGHVLLEDVPGVGKTILAKSLAVTVGGSFKRVQFTPDLLPADITGFNVYDQKHAQFKFQPGPAITNVLLADEINRTVPRTQASLLECMEERQITVDGQTLSLPCPFFVIATQNPIELEGTFPLPEAQLDRFLLKVRLGYPEKREEMAILERFQTHDPLADLQTVASPEEIVDMQRVRRQVLVAEPVREYITDIVSATRSADSLQYGASPRGSMGLMRVAQALALIQGRDYVLPDDVKHLVIPVLAHRLILSPEQRLRGETPDRFLNEMLEQLPVPAGAL